jgi:hypothetical protein
MKVLNKVRDKINSSKLISKHTGNKYIEVGIFGYTELQIINDSVMFLCKNGLHYNIWNGDCSLEDLIDILEN